MRTWLLIIAVVLLPTLSWSAGFPARSPAIRNPIGTGTAPVSSYRNGLVANPVPIDATADLSMTGNLRGGKHFRGNVPYRSTSDLGTDPGSSSLNSYRSTPSLSSFLRDAAGPEDFGRRSSVAYGAQPYYSPAEAVARTVPGRADVFAPHGTGNSFGARQQGRSATTHAFAMESMPKQHVSLERDTSTTSAGFQRFQAQYSPFNESLSTSDGTFVRGLTPGLRDVERLTPGEVATVRQQDDKTLERFREQTRQPLLDRRRDSRIDERGVPIGDERRQLDPRVPVPSSASAKDAVAARYGLYPAETFMPPVNPALKQEAARQDSLGLGTTRAALTSGEHDGFMNSQPDTGRVNAESGYALPSQSIVRSGLASDKEHDAVLGRIRQQLDELSMSVESRLKTRPSDARNAGVVAPAEMGYVAGRQAQRSGPVSRGAAGRGHPDSSYLLKEHQPRVGKEMLAPATTSVPGGIDNTGEKRFESPTISSLRSAQKIRSLPGGIAEPSRAEMTHEAKRIMGKHRSPGSFAADKFNQHLRTAEDYLRAGKYYKAADSFALASIYSPNDTQALAGRSHALFAAGEYISSALFLSRALAIRPEYAKTKVDFVTLLGGPNRLAGRTADVEQWLARSGSGQLQLLLGYVYYQTGRLGEAKRAVEAAYAKMPQSPAIPAIMVAINDAAARQ